MAKRRFSGNASASKRRRRSPRMVRNFRKRRSKLGRPSRGMRQSTYMFKRQITEIVPLVAAGSGTWSAAGDNGLYKQCVFKLSDLNNITEFTSLFKRYKINAVKLEICFSNTASAATSVPDPPGTQTTPDCQMQVYTTPNKSGRTSVLTEAILMNTQAKKKRYALTGGRPIKIFMKTKQLGMKFHSATDTDYGTQYPQYISTGETGTCHYGMDLYINRVDGAAFTTGNTGNQSMRVTATYYLTFKGVE